MFDTNICRLCAESSSSLLPIFDPILCEKDRLVLKIKKCFPSLVMHENDSKPKQVCVSCVSKLNVCNELFDLCSAAESKFETILRRHYPLQDDVEGSEMLASCVLKQNTNCLWSRDINKNDKTLTVHDGGVIVLSKMESEILTQQNEDDGNRNFEFVMVEVKYKGNEAESGEANYMTSDGANGLEDVVDEPETDRVDHSRLQPTSVVLLQQASSSFSEDKSQEKYLRLISNNSSESKDSKVTREESKKRSGLERTDGSSCSTVVGKRFTCTVCGKQFKRRTRLNCHVGSMHTEVRPHRCNQCGKSFVMRWDLTLHQRIHSDAFQCEFCQKSFNTKSKLDRHRRTHTGERPHVCPYCAKSFGDKRNLDNHLRLHTGEKPFSCDLCGRSFRVKTHLTQHRRVHTRETPFQCAHCGKLFRWKANFNAHVKLHNSNEHCAIHANTG